MLYKNLPLPLCVYQISGKQLPEWGFHQLEVVTDKLHNHEHTLWNVEEHRYTRSKSGSTHAVSQGLHKQ